MKNKKLLFTFMIIIMIFAFKGCSQNYKENTENLIKKEEPQLTTTVVALNYKIPLESPQYLNCKFVVSNSKEKEKVIMEDKSVEKFTAYEGKIRINKNDIKINNNNYYNFTFEQSYSFINNKDSLKTSYCNLVIDNKKDIGKNKLKILEQCKSLEEIESNNDVIAYYVITKEKDTKIDLTYKDCLKNINKYECVIGVKISFIDEFNKKNYLS